jgi:hypothetical protein
MRTLRATLTGWVLVAAIGWSLFILMACSFSSWELLGGSGSNPLWIPTVVWVGGILFILWVGNTSSKRRTSGVAARQSEAGGDVMRTLRAALNPYTIVVALLWTGFLLVHDIFDVHLGNIFCQMNPSPRCGHGPPTVVWVVGMLVILGGGYALHERGKPATGATTLADKLKAVAVLAILLAFGAAAWNAAG